MTTSDWVLKEIHTVKEQQLTSLVLANLKEIPGEIRELKQLTSLILTGEYNEIPAFIGEMQQLTFLRLSGKYKPISPYLERLQQLSSLLLSGSYSEIPAFIGELKQLSSLLLSGSYSEIPAFIGELKNLHSLHLSGWYGEIPNSIGELKQLSSLSLYGSYSEIPAFIGELKNLHSLHLSGWYGEVPAFVGDLKQLTSLTLAGNYIEIPEFIGELQRLTSLELFGSYKKIPDSIYFLKDLARLYIPSKHLKSISPSVLQLTKLDYLKADSSKIQSPPPEIARAGLKAIKQYFLQLEQDEVDYLYEAKLLIVGEGGAGKTSFARKLVNPKAALPSEDETTWGIQVNQWQFPLENEKSFRVNIWDFGGQEIYHATHQFFLTKRSLYALVADSRNETKDFNFWMNIVELLSDKSPLLIIKNEKQNRPCYFNEPQLKGRFEIIKDIFSTNLEDGRGLENIREFIQYQIKNLPHIGAVLPKKWVDVRRRLEEDKRNYILYKDFEKICKEEGIIDTEAIETLIGYLHDLGVCLHFRDEAVLKRYVILKPAWATNAAYAVLHVHSAIIEVKQGRFDRDDLDIIWGNPEYEGMHEELLRLMMKFGLCYKVPDAELYIAPQLLSDNEPNYEWNKYGSLMIRYEYDFMPAGLLSRFIVQRHRQIDNDLVWKTGVIIKNQDGRAEIKESLDKREIVIRVDGKDKKGLLSIILDEFDGIHQSFHNLNVKTLVPCNCSECSRSLSPHFFRLDTLKRMEQKGNDITCEQSGILMRASALINDTFPYRRKDDRNF